MQMMAVVNQKGGVGKTTTTVNLAHALVLAGKKVTVIDIDPQGHLAISLGANESPRSGMDEVLLGNAAINDYLIEVRDGLHLVPAGPRLGDVELLAQGGAARGFKLKNALNGHFDSEDFVLLDCPPASGLLMVNALVASGEILVPVSGDYLGLRGLVYLAKTCKRLEGLLKRSIARSIVLTRYHQRRRLARAVRQKLQHYFPGEVFATPIREVSALAECPRQGKTIFEYRRRSNGALDYHALARDLIDGRMM